MNRFNIFDSVTDPRGDQKRSQAHVSNFRRIDRNVDDAVKGGKTREDVPSSAFSQATGRRPVR